MPKRKPRVAVADTGKLKNPRWEAFAQLTAAGAKRGVAYKNAGFDPSTKAEATNRASKLIRKHPEIKARIAELEEELRDNVLKRAEVTREAVLRGIQDNIDRALQKKPVLDREGNPTGEFVYNGSVVNRGYELMGKELGMFAERMLVGSLDGELEGMNTEQLRGYVRMLSNEVGLRVVDMTTEQTADWIRRNAERCGLKVVSLEPDPEPTPPAGTPSLH